MKNLIVYAIIAGAGYYGYQYWKTSQPFQHVSLFGKVESQDKAAFLNDRMVVGFLGEKELARAITSTSAGMSSGSDSSGTFRLDLVLPFSVVLTDLKLPSRAKAEVSKDPQGLGTWRLFVDLGELADGADVLSIPIPSKRERLGVAVLGSDVRSFSDDMKRTGSFGLSASGNLYMSSFWWKERATRAGLVTEAESAEEFFEPLESRRLIVDNCAGRTTKKDTWRWRQMFPVVTEMYGERYVGVEETFARSLATITANTAHQFRLVPQTPFGIHEEYLAGEAQPNSRVSVTVQVSSRFLKGTAHLSANRSDTSHFRVSNGIRISTSAKVESCSSAN